MKVKFYGTRGSIPVSGPDFMEFGGNTTSLRIFSQCIPDQWCLAVDAGSGFVPMALDCLKAGVNNVAVLFTHYHYDHIIGLTLSPITFIKSIKIQCYGPEEFGINPVKMMEHLFKPPFFPVDFREVRSHFSFKGIDLPNSRIFLIHPKGGLKYFTIDQFEAFERDHRMIPFGPGQRYELDECMVVRMHRSNHPERTISYRFEERPTGKVFVFLTDHENQDGIPQNFMNHTKGADLLVMDAQYDRHKYDTRTAGFGHGTPDYCVDVAIRSGAGMLGLTHHDPASSDDKIREILDEAQSTLNARDDNDKNLQVFVCRDYQEIELM